MTSFFPDYNVCFAVWLALSVADHTHNGTAWKWLRLLPHQNRLIFSRHTQIGLLRLLTNASVMGKQTLTLRKARDVYDRWLQDPRVDFYPEPRNIDAGFRQATEPFAAKPASRWVGDCWLLACAAGNQAMLVTFDRAVVEFARNQGHTAVIPS
jgi:toxin-antitoxin system PIN domain toxin